MADPPSTDLLVVGGGIVGLSVALFAAREGLSVVLVDPRPFGSASTARSGALIRTHYPTAGEAVLARQGLELFERFDEVVGGPSGFRRCGFAYVPTGEELADGSFAARMEMLVAHGIETRIVEADELATIDPAIDLSDVGVAAYEPRSGYADPAQTTASLANAARAAGAELRLGVAVPGLRVDGGLVVGAETSAGFVAAGAVCVCAGVRSAEICASAGLTLPLQATAIGLLTVPRRVDGHLMVIDAPGGVYFRPDAPRATMVGLRAFGDVVLDPPTEDPSPPGPAFHAEALAALARRLPSSAGATVVAGRAGQLDMTPDGRPLLGPTSVEGLWLSCGWSGTGFKTGPSAGLALARWIASGSPTEPALSEFSPHREHQPPAAVRSPH